MGHKFTRRDLEALLQGAMGKTFEEVDVRGLIDRYMEANPNKVVKGVPGDIIEQSVLGLPKDSLQKADLIIDGVPTELKTTGVYRRENGRKVEYVAKERLTITTINYSGIANERFENSHLWEKINKILLVFYQYGDSKASSTADYKNFMYLLYSYMKFSKEEIDNIKADWERVKNFFASEYGINVINELKGGNLTDWRRKELRKILSDSLNGLGYLEVSPKFPRARLAIKNSYFKEKTAEIFNQKKYSARLNDISSYDDLIVKISSSVAPYSGKTLGEIAEEASSRGQEEAARSISKASTSHILGYILTGKYVKAGLIEQIAKSGFVAKTVTVKPGGYKKEDMKLTPVVFSEFSDGTVFEDSSFYNFIFGNRFLCGVFERAPGGALRDRSKDIFVGVKIIEFSDAIFEESARSTWDKVSRMYLNNEIKSFPELRKNGEFIINRNGQKKMGTNLPKSSEYEFFLRGTGTDSSRKSHIINGYAMYHQDYWVRGSLVVDLLNKVDFI